MSWIRRVDDGWLLALHVQPGAKSSEVTGMHGDALKIRIAAPALDGRANDALAAFIAARLGVPKNFVAVVKGATSRRKSVLVADGNADPGLLLTDKS